MDSLKGVRAHIIYRLVKKELFFFKFSIYGGSSQA
jgi:hypothetical protein